MLKLDFPVAGPNDKDEMVITKLDLGIKYSQLVKIIGQPHTKNKKSTFALWRFKIGNKSFTIHVSLGSVGSHVGLVNKLEDSEYIMFTGNPTIIQDVVFELLRYAAGKPVSSNSKRNVVKRILSMTERS